MKKSFLIAGFAALSFLVAACNTIEGVGEDVGAAGETVEDAANNGRT